MEQAIARLSKIHNVCIAEIFSRMGIIEQGGTGLQRMIQGCREYGVQEPEFIDMGDAFEAPAITQKEIAQKVGMSQNGIRYTIDKLKDRGILEWEGATKRGKWIVNLLY